MLIFVLSIVFQLNATNSHELFSQPSSPYSIVFFHRSSSPFCSHLFHPWESLSAHFRASPNLTLAKIDCDNYNSVCKTHLKNSEDFPVFLQISGSRRIEISFGPDFPSMLNYANSLLSLPTKSLCQKFNGTVPAVVFHGNADSVCATVQHFSYHVPDIVDQIFWVDDRPRLGLEVIDREGRSFVYEGPRRSLAYVRFIREYTLPQWGTWDPIQVHASRRLAFLVYGDRGQLEGWEGTFSEFYDRILFGSMPLELFRERYPSVRIRDSDMPVMCVVGDRGKFSVIRRFKTTESRGRLYEWLNLALSGRRASSMRYVFKPAQKPPPNGILRARTLICGSIAGGSLLSTIGIILNHVRTCIRPLRRRSGLLSSF
jgi:hypothetical protein